MRQVYVLVNIHPAYLPKDKNMIEIRLVLFGRRSVAESDKQALLKKEKRCKVIVDLIIDAFIIMGIDFLIFYVVIMNAWWKNALSREPFFCVLLTFYGIGYVSFFIVEIMILSRCFKEEGKEDGEAWPVGFMLAVFFAVGWPIHSIILIKAVRNLQKKQGTGMHYHDLINEFTDLALGKD